jgi:hypothetical protein
MLAIDQMQANACAIGQCLHQHLETLDIPWLGVDVRGLPGHGCIRRNALPPR